MKIISKYKDYYDYLVHSKYGMDEAVVMDRRNGFTLTDNELKAYDAGFYKIIKVAICDIMYTAVTDCKSNIKWCHDIDGCGEWSNDYKGGKYYTVKTYGSWSERVDLNPVPTDINSKINCPIVLFDHHCNSYPQLSNLNISSIISPNEMYITIYNWLLKQKEVNHVDNRSNVQKVESHGFDNKKSFRHRK